MPFQVVARTVGKRIGWPAWRIGLLLMAVAIPVIVAADGGFYSQTKHGSPTDGVHRDPAQPTGSCVQCHTGHGQSQQDFGLWVADDNNLCFTCHSSEVGSYSGQTTYSLSGHSISASSVNGRLVGLCVQCHNAHGAGDTGGAYAHLTARSEEQVCFTCHGSGFRPQGAADVQIQVSKRYSHAVASFQRLHDDTAEFGSTISNPNPQLSGPNRHVECADCHNTHYGRTSSRPDRSSNIGDSLLGSWGVRPTYSGAAWTAPTNYVIERFQNTSTEYEYYLCLKCHSNWSWGSVAPFTADGVPETNQAMEFNPANPSYHNATGQPSSAVPAETGGAYLGLWDRGSAMACSDCHAGDPSSTARGAHGSTYAFLLKKPFQAKSGVSGNTGTAGTQSHLCFDCHDWNTYGPQGSGSQTNYRKGTDNLHRKSEHRTSLGCFQCHSAVPHGFKRQHMIVYVTDGAPYFVGGTKGITSYTHASPGSYSQSSCATTAGCH